MRIRHTYLTAMLAVASAALASTLAAAPPAAADCISAAGATPSPCARRVNPSSHTFTRSLAATPYIPLDCDADWLCDQGLGIALSD